jgi:hypothetical protein
MLRYDVCTYLHESSFEPPPRKCFHDFLHIALLDIGAEVEHSERCAHKFGRQSLPNSALRGMNHRLAGMAAESVSKLRHVAEHVVYAVAVQGVALR